METARASDLPLRLPERRVEIGSPAVSSQHQHNTPGGGGDPTKEEGRTATLFFFCIDIVKVPLPTITINMKLLRGSTIAQRIIIGF